MARSRHILKRARAVRNIREVTKTMEMVSTARFKRTHARAVGARRYTDAISSMVGSLIARDAMKDFDHPLLHPVGDVKRDVLLVLTSNRGLCGAYNNNVISIAMERLAQVLAAGYEVSLRVAGKRGAQALRHLRMEVDHAYDQFTDVPEWDQVSQLTEDLVADFIAGRIGGLEVAYTRFISPGRQRPVIAQVLPLTELETLAPPRTPATTIAPYDFVPSANEVLARLLPAVVRLRVYQFFLDAAASEQVARMSSMRVATDNADEMIRGLTLKYNRTRQTQITSELSEIIGGRAGAKEM